MGASLGEKDCVDEGGCKEGCSRPRRRRSVTPRTTGRLLACRRVRFGRRGGLVDISALP
jgi:hypothetical protein